MENYYKFLCENKLPNERNVYGFIYELLLFSKISKISINNIINKIKNDVKIYILSGWGDFSQNDKKTMLEWEDSILGTNSFLNIDFKSNKEEEIIYLSNKIFDKIYKIKQENKNLTYTKIFLENINDIMNSI